MRGKIITKVVKILHIATTRSDTRRVFAPERREYTLRTMTRYRGFSSRAIPKPAETLITIFSLPYTSNTFIRFSVLYFFLPPHLFFRTVNPRKSAVTAINLQSCERPTFIIALACEVWYPGRTCIHGRAPGSVLRDRMQRAMLLLLVVVCVARVGDG